MTFKAGDKVRALDGTFILKKGGVFLVERVEGSTVYINFEEYGTLSYAAHWFEIVTDEEEQTNLPEPNHICKSWPHFFQAIKNGTKAHDLRLNDRDFKAGDKVLLQEYDPFKGVYTGEELLVEVTFITSSATPCAYSSAALAREYAILSLRIVN